MNIYLIRWNNAESYSGTSRIMPNQAFDSLDAALDGLAEIPFATGTFGDYMENFERNDASMGQGEVKNFTYYSVIEVPLTSRKN